MAVTLASLYTYMMQGIEFQVSMREKVLEEESFIQIDKMECVFVGEK